MPIICRIDSIIYLDACLDWVLLQNQLEYFVPQASKPNPGLG
jgi:hypothetical protein